MENQVNQPSLSQAQTESKQVIDYSDVEKYLDNLPPLAVFDDDFYTCLDKLNTPEECLMYFLQCHRNFLNLEIAKNGQISVKSSYSYRTITDIYRLLNFGKKRISLENLYKAVINCYRKKESIYSHVCASIGKRVYNFSHVKEFRYIGNTADEYGFIFPTEFPKGSGYCGNISNSLLRIKYGKFESKKESL